MAVTPIFKFDDDQIIEALEATRCNLAQASIFLAKKWGRSCHRKYVASTVKKRRRLVEFVREFREIVADQAEANIFQAVENGDYQASVLVVRTLGKDRGWVPKAEKDLMLPAENRLEAIARGRARASMDGAAVATRRPREGVAPTAAALNKACILSRKAMRERARR